MNPIERVYDALWLGCRHSPDGRAKGRRASPHGRRIDSPTQSGSRGHFRTCRELVLPARAGRVQLAAWPVRSPNIWRRHAHFEQDQPGRTRRLRWHAVGGFAGCLGANHSIGAGNAFSANQWPLAAVERIEILNMAHRAGAPGSRRRWTAAHGASPPPCATTPASTTRSSPKRTSVSCRPAACAWSSPTKRSISRCSTPGIKNLQLSASIKNAFDRQPPFSATHGTNNNFTQMGFAETYNGRGRYFQPGLKYSLR